MEKTLQYAIKSEDYGVRSTLSTIYHCVAKCYEESGGSKKADFELSDLYNTGPKDQGPFYHGTRADLQIGDFLVAGRDITVTFDMGGGILWSVNGKEVITDKAGDIDFSVKTGTSMIPVDIVNNVTEERYSIRISLAHGGEFGFTAVLSIGLGRENAGYTASLYYYNENTGELEFICSGEVAEDGTGEAERS